MPAALAIDGSQVKLRATQLKRPLLDGVRGMSMALYKRRVATAVSSSAILVLMLCASGCKEQLAADKLPAPKVTVSPVVSRETTDADEYIGRTEASEIV